MSGFAQHARKELARIEAELASHPLTVCAEHLRRYIAAVDAPGEAADAPRPRSRRASRTQKTRRKAPRGPRQNVTRSKGVAKKKRAAKAGVAELQDKIVGAIGALNAEGKAISYAAIGEIVGIPAPNVFYHLKALLAAKRIAKSGSGRSAPYVVASSRAARVPVAARAERPACPDAAREVFDYLKSQGVDVEVLANGRFRYGGDRIGFDELVQRANRQRVIEGLAKFPAPEAA